MRRWNQCRLIDILSSIDLSLLEGHFPEVDLEKVKKIAKRKHGKARVWIAVVSGFAAGSAALTGVVVFFLSRRKIHSAR